MTWKCFRLLLMLLLLSSPKVFAQAIIVHPEQSTTQLTQTTIRAIFAMRIPTWPDGTPIHVFVLKDNAPLHIHFCKSILGMFPYQLRKIWDRQVFSGTGVEPTVVSSEQEMLEKIASTKGAIGYAEPDAIDQTVKLLRLPL